MLADSFRQYIPEPIFRDYFNPLAAHFGQKFEGLHVEVSVDNLVNCKNLMAAFSRSPSFNNLLSLNEKTSLDDLYLLFASEDFNLTKSFRNCSSTWSWSKSSFLKYVACYYVYRLILELSSHVNRDLVRGIMT